MNVIDARRVLNGDVVVVGATVPEPSTIAMIAASALGLAGIVCKKLR